jgi:hypothetical protein
LADKDQIEALLAIASAPRLLRDAQNVAARKLLDYDGEKYPHDGCAITLSVLLQEAGILVPDTFMAVELGDILKNDRNWSVIEVGNQQAGDVGSTCRAQARHGQDHIYLVLKVVNPDEMVIADNQDTHPHFRFASGAGGKTPTRFFLRAPG